MCLNCGNCSKQHPLTIDEMIDTADALPNLKLTTSPALSLSR